MLIVNLFTKKLHDSLAQRDTFCLENVNILFCLKDWIATVSSTGYASVYL